MVGDRLFSRPLVAFLASVAAIVLGCLAKRWWPVSPAAAMVQLHDGDLERRERHALLQLLLAAGEPGGEAIGRELRLGAAMAAVAMEDEGAYGRLLHRLGGPLPVATGDADILDTAGLGDPVLSPLLQAMLLEARGQRAAAAAAYRQVSASSRLFAMSLAGRLAVAGLERSR